MFNRVSILILIGVLCLSSFTFLHIAPSASAGLQENEWLIENFGGFYSFEPDGTVRLWSNGEAVTLYREFRRNEDFNVSIEAYGVELGTFGLFLRDSLPIAGSMHGINLEFRETGEFLLSRLTNGGWTSPVFAAGTAGRWYTMKLLVFKTPFHVVAQVFENSTLLGSLDINDMANISFESLRYVGFGIWYTGKEFHARNSEFSGLSAWSVDDDGPADFSTIQEAIHAASDGDTIFVRNGTYSGIVIDKSLTIEGEDKYTTIIQGGSEPYGAGMRVLANNVRISEFTIQNARGPPIRVHGDEGPSYGNITITDNIMTGCGEPVRLINTTGDMISCNVIRDSSGGIGFDWANGNIVNNNTLINVGIGIVGGYPSHNNTFSENTIIGNSNAVSMNNIFDNNRFFHNNFINDSIQVDLTEGSNSWDNSYPSGGNYWSDYNGTDLYLGSAQDQLGSDGIGDTPYLIDANNTDHYPLMNPWTPPDAAALNITSSKTIVGQGFSTNLTVSVENQGSKIEELNATFYANDMFIGSQTFMLTSNNSIIYSSDWNLSSLEKGNYSLSIRIVPLEGETDLNDNSLNGSWIFITIPGDLNGDKTVDIYDAIILAGHFNFDRYHVSWDPNVDINNDGIIDIYDAIMLAANYGKSWT